MGIRVGIIGFTNIRYMPYLRYYTKVLDEHGVDYELIYWDRRELNEEPGCKKHVMKMRLDDAAPKTSKIVSMLRYGQFVKRVVLQREYGFLIFLTPIPAVILSRFLGARYINRYVVDIRDYSWEHNPIYFAALRQVLRNAAMRVISSPAFKDFLPVGDYFLCHNLSIPRDAPRPLPRDRRINEPIRVSYIGAIAYFEEVRKFIDAIANDDRIIFSLYGSGMDEERLESYCKSAQISNVHFHGAYSPDNLERIYSATDIVFNYYGNDNSVVKHALSNKLYNAAWHQLPIIVSPQTAMAAATGYMGFEADYTKGGVADALYEWYSGLDWDKMQEASTTLLDAAIADNNIFKQELIKALCASRGQ